ncbi:hypothetical protein HPB52_000590 [Rhipicephalus sanguineus]|uniref:Uncharacterized protein n=1 Tax=Rhipicephalus sanguineus TaxID=34632 RepID=A0A9D4QCM0_RHISA|nr:hypothetical protein HPB52_000590 [Rhipicephalus sanguineus]
MGDENPIQQLGPGRPHHCASDASDRFGASVVNIDTSDGSSTEDTASDSDFTVVSSRDLKRKIRKTSLNGRQAPKKLNDTFFGISTRLTGSGEGNFADLWAQGNPLSKIWRVVRILQTTPKQCHPFRAVALHHGRREIEEETEGSPELARSFMSAFGIRNAEVWWKTRGRRCPMPTAPGRKSRPRPPLCSSRTRLRLYFMPACRCGHKLPKQAALSAFLLAPA